MVWVEFVIIKSWRAPVNTLRTFYSCVGPCGSVTQVASFPSRASVSQGPCWVGKASEGDQPALQGPQGPLSGNEGPEPVSHGRIGIFCLGELGHPEKALLTELGRAQNDMLAQTSFTAHSPRSKQVLPRTVSEWGSS